MSAKRLDSLLTPGKGGDLSDIVRRARDIGELTTALARALPDDLRQALLAANLRDDGTLVVVCRSPAWASRLRFEADALLGAARAHGVPAEKLLVRVGRQDHE